VTQLAAQIAESLDNASAVMGTLGWGRIGQLQSSTHTTPDAIAVQSQLAALRDEGVQSVFMEVSSHALDQSRVGGVRFDTAVFTNISRDHLDYHGDMAAYEAAKTRLFAWPELQHAVINGDDAAGCRLLALPDMAARAVSYSTRNASADVYASDIRYAASGLQARVHTPWGVGTLRCRLMGEFNLSNALAVIAVLGLQGHALQRILSAFETVSPVIGRLESVAVHRGVNVVIDYAHTPDALEKALLTLRVHTSGRLHVVFGCGGDRDAGKRPLMGRAAECHADRLYLTSDNPRHESAAVILQAIAGGLAHPESVQIIEDRASAIRAALDAATEHDTVLIAGKGHETWQQVGDEKRPFSDHAVVHAWLASHEVQS
jgi:UDP-N-acetylmuramoyl-L-alanyl-D-glutamate--2,6-diaminopimelate ligase